MFNESEAHYQNGHYVHIHVCFKKRHNLLQVLKVNVCTIRAFWSIIVLSNDDPVLVLAYFTIK